MFFLIYIPRRGGGRETISSILAIYIAQRKYKKILMSNIYFLRVQHTSVGSGLSCCKASPGGVQFSAGGLSAN
jgi:hypothetical protein